MSLRFDYLAVGLFGLVMCSCTRSSFEGGADDPSRVSLIPTVRGVPYIPVNSSAMQYTVPTSRADGGAFEPQDRIGLFVTRDAGLQSTGNYLDNIGMESTYGTASGVTEEWRHFGPGFPDPLERGRTYKAWAYYPYREPIADLAAMDVSVWADQSTHEGFIGSDFMVSGEAALSTTNLEAPTAAFDFHRKMAQMTVMMTVPINVDKQKVVSLDGLSIGKVVRSATYNMLTDVLTVGTDRTSNVKMYRSSGTGLPGSFDMYHVLLPAQELLTSELLERLELHYTVQGGAQVVSPARLVGDHTLDVGTNLRFVLTAPSGEAFVSSLDLSDGLYHKGLPLTIRAGKTLPYTVTAPDGGWLKLAAKPEGPYSYVLKGLGQGSNHDIYVEVQDNTSLSSATRKSHLELYVETVEVHAVYEPVQRSSRFASQPADVELPAGYSSVMVDVFGGNNVWYGGIKTGETWAYWAWGAGAETYNSGTRNARYPADNTSGMSRFIQGELPSATNLHYQMAPNNTAIERLSHFTIAAVDGNGEDIAMMGRTKTIKQRAPELTLTPSNRTVLPHIDRYTIAVSGTGQQGVKWTPKVDLGTIIPNAEQTIPTPTYSLLFNWTFGHNTTAADQTITFTAGASGGTLPFTAPIKQLGSRLTIDKSVTNVGADATSTPMVLNSTVAWAGQVTSSTGAKLSTPAWAPTNESTPYNGTVTLSFPFNGGSYPTAGKTHTVEITSTDSWLSPRLEQGLTVYQAGVPASLTLSTYNGGLIKSFSNFQDIYVTSNCDWAVSSTSSPHTMSIWPSSGRAGTTRVSITVGWNYNLYKTTSAVTFITRNLPAGVAPVSRTWSGTRRSAAFMHVRWGKLYNDPFDHRGLYVYTNSRVQVRYYSNKTGKWYTTNVNGSNDPVWRQGDPWKAQVWQKVAGEEYVLGTNDANVDYAILYDGDGTPLATANMKNRPDIAFLYNDYGDGKNCSKDGNQHRWGTGTQWEPQGVENLGPW